MCHLQARVATSRGAHNFCPTHPKPTVVLPADPVVKAVREVFRGKTKAAAQPQAEDLWTCLPDALLGRVLPRLSFHCAANQASHLDTAHLTCIGGLSACSHPPPAPVPGLLEGRREPAVRQSTGRLMVLHGPGEPYWLQNAGHRVP